MATLAKGVFVVAAKRTPFGTYGGAFVKTSALELQEVAAKAALAAGNVAPEKIDQVIIGHVMANTSPDGVIVPRHVLLRSGIPQDRPAYAVNRLCGSGFQSVSILVGESEIVLTGGVDNMSQAPYAVRNVRFGAPPLGTRINFEDTLWEGLTDTYCKLAMGQTAEKLAEKYNLTRAEVDAFGLRSQQLWKKAHDEGRFKEELAPVTVTIKRKQVVVEFDEHPRPQTTIEGLQKLPTVFKKDGVVTAGTSSGICDGAGAVILASEKAVKENNLTPLARIVACTVVGVDPSIMGIGPAPAITNINEAFGAQTLSCAKELKLDLNKLNPDGGAIALGHPLGASGEGRPSMVLVPPALVAVKE
ncbi:unnamed protein product [Nezara viridula]|uniref:Uncharacterized protein n=1 Tax=Nezara viridula TaxID=85310 RepID=A0A9P0EBT8_NEZVI|nr:unnamed protein product [Nezara viridula]